MASKPKGIIIPKKFLKNMWTHNPHGLGFVVAHDEQLFMSKGFRNFKDFWRSYRDLQAFPAVIHMRWANRGKIHKENDHPFFVDEDLAFAHNGTVSIDLEEDHSDTKMLCEKVLKPLKNRDEKFLNKDFNRWLLSKSIGHSKLAFLDRHGNLDIINDKLGEYHEGVWYSNADFKNFTLTNFKKGGKKTSTQLAGFSHASNAAYDQASLYENYQ
jgi:hypothetical protein